jgi:hypothetical protein
MTRLEATATHGPAETDVRARAHPRVARDHALLRATRPPLRHNGLWPRATRQRIATAFSTKSQLEILAMGPLPKNALLSVLPLLDLVRMGPKPLLEVMT